MRYLYLILLLLISSAAIADEKECIYCVMNESYCNLPDDLSLFNPKLTNPLKCWKDGKEIYTSLYDLSNSGWLVSPGQKNMMKNPILFERIYKADFYKYLKKISVISFVFLLFVEFFFIKIIFNTKVDNNLVEIESHLKDTKIIYCKKWTVYLFGAYSTILLLVLIVNVLFETPLFYIYPQFIISSVLSVILFNLLLTPTYYIIWKSKKK